MLIRIWDVRKLGKLALETSDSLEFDSEAVQKFVDSDAGHGSFRGEWRHGKSVSSAYWDPRGRSIVSTSYDDTIRSEPFLDDDHLHSLNNVTVWGYGPSVLESDEPFPSLRPQAQVQHNCQTVGVFLPTSRVLQSEITQGKWLTILRAQWSPNPDVFPHYTVGRFACSLVLVDEDIFKIGNMHHSLDIRTGKVCTRWCPWTVNS